MKWIKFDPDAWIAGTRELTWAEKGLYIELIAILYSRDGKLLNDDNMIARILQCNPRTWRKLRPKLVSKGKIRLTGDGYWTANRVQFELNSARIRIELDSNKSKSAMKSKVDPKISLTTSREERKKTSSKVFSSFESEAKERSNGGSLASAPCVGALASPPCSEQDRARRPTRAELEAKYPDLFKRKLHA